MSQVTNIAPEKCYIDVRWVTVPLLIYLALPGILWLLGWVNPLYSVPSVLLLCYTIYRVVRHINSPQYEGGASCRVLLNSRSLAALLLIAFISALISEITGLTGHVPQNADYSVRNAMYQTLVACDWPVYLHDGSYLVYYLGFWLVPAALSKLIAPDACWLILQAWVFVGLFFAFSSLYLSKGKNAVFFILVLLSVSDSFSMYGLGGQRVFGWFCLRLGDILNCSSICDYPKLLEHMFWFYHPSPLWNCVNSYHLVIPTWCVCSLLFTRSVPDCYYLFVASLLLVSSPLSAIAVLLVLLVMLLTRWDRSHMSVLSIFASSVLLLPLALYLCCNSAGMVKISVLRATSYLAYFVSWLPNILLVLLPICVIFWKHRKNAIFISFISLFVCLPIMWIGANHANEFLLKGGCVLWYCFAWMVAFFEIRSRFQKVILSFVLLIMLTFPIVYLCGVLRSYRVTPERAYISNILEGHFNHSDDKPYCFQFRGKQPPSLLLQRSGESACGVLRPLRTGVCSKQYYGEGVDVPGE